MRTETEKKFQKNLENSHEEWSDRLIDDDSKKSSKT
jgi:hypothetical protein